MTRVAWAIFRNLERGTRVAQSAEHPVDRKTSGMAPVVDGEVGRSSRPPGATPSRCRAQVAIRVAGVLATIVALVGAGMVLGAFVGGAW